jgi:hypothetical protein
MNVVMLSVVAPYLDLPTKHGKPSHYTLTPKILKLFFLGLQCCSLGAYVSIT